MQNVEVANLYELLAAWFTCQDPFDGRTDSGGSGWRQGGHPGDGGGVCTEPQVRCQNALRGEAADVSP